MLKRPSKRTPKRWGILQVAYFKTATRQRASNCWKWSGYLTTKAENCLERRISLVNHSTQKAHADWFGSQFKLNQRPYFQT